MNIYYTIQEWVKTKKSMREIRNDRPVVFVLNMVAPGEKTRLLKKCNADVICSCPGGEYGIIKYGDIFSVDSPDEMLKRIEETILQHALVLEFENIHEAIAHMSGTVCNRSEGV